MAENLDELSSRYQVIQKNIEKAKSLKITLEERKKSTEKQLRTLIDKIKAAGYDSKNLKDVRDTKLAELKKLVEEKEKEVKEVLSKLQAIDMETSL